MKVCLECGNIFNRFSELKEGIICPKLFCSGKVVEIDDAILHTILLLNQKGYRTTHCCSGHTWGNDPFIVFDKKVCPETFLSLPKDFTTKIIFDGTLRLSKSIFHKDSVKRQRELMRASVDLITWADKLRSSQTMEVDFILPNLINEKEVIKEVEQLFHLDFMEFQDDYDIVEGKKRICLDLLIDPAALKKLTENMKAFADKKGFELITNLYDL